MLNVETLNLAKTLCTVDADRDGAAFRTNLGDLQTQFYNDIVLARSAGRLVEVPMKNRLMHRFLWYMSNRFSDWMQRMSLIDWIWAEFAEDKNADSLSFYSYGALCIKDFHYDVSALMDSFAPIAILLNHEFNSKEQKKLPGFADIQKGTNRSYRADFSSGLIALIDDTERWWPVVKAVRDTIAHREHTNLVFGDPREKIKMFQVYDSLMTPRMIEKPLLRPATNNIVDFEKYACFIFSEILAFAHRLGELVAAEMSIPIKGVLFYQTHSTYLITNIDELISTAA